ETGQHAGLTAHCLRQNKLGDAGADWRFFRRTRRAVGSGGSFDHACLPPVFAERANRPGRGPYPRRWRRRHCCRFQHAAGGHRLCGGGAGAQAGNPHQRRAAQHHHSVRHGGDRPAGQLQLFRPLRRSGHWHRHRGPRLGDRHRLRAAGRAVQPDAVVASTAPPVHRLGMAPSASGVVRRGMSFGSGYGITSQVIASEVGLPWHAPITRFLATVVTYFSGIPGGIFAPSLAVGAAVGSNAAELFHLALQPTIALCMVGFLAAVTQSPITSAIIVMEMIDSHGM
nr:hypothetical protein [Tanacetum cinerariifolium]